MVTSPRPAGRPAARSFPSFGFQFQTPPSFPVLIIHLDLALAPWCDKFARSRELAAVGSFYSPRQVAIGSTARFQFISKHGPMAGLGLFDQKSAIAVTMPIVTAFKFCIGHRKNGLLNR